MFGAGGYLKIGIDTLSKTGENGTDCGEKDEPCSPVPAVEVVIDPVGVVHIADIEFLVANEVEVGDEDTGNGTHETGITGKECKELGTLDDD